MTYSRCLGCFREVSNLVIKCCQKDNSKYNLILFYLVISRKGHKKRSWWPLCSCPRGISPFLLPKLVNYMLKMSFGKRRNEVFTRNVWILQTDLAEAYLFFFLSLDRTWLLGSQWFSVDKKNCDFCVVFNNNPAVKRIISKNSEHVILIWLTTLLL